ncbi:hypothetical protein ACH4S8_37325 [Streptomyces sp. NPDC021080]|uniref:hypothetical protein n=1 Tax=Streptomyces sp. NPDC021080 TaxID=3365110 RepID=UPI00379B1841
MTVTTPAQTQLPPLPSHIQEAVEAAQRVDWKVVCSLSSVSITPIGHKRGISFSLTKPPTAEQVRIQMDRCGIKGALRKLGASETATLPEPEPVHSSAEEDQVEAKKLICPECDSDKFTRPASLASHRSKAHGVAGSSQSTKERRAARGKTAAAKTAKAPKPAADKAAPPVFEEPAQTNRPVAEPAFTGTPEVTAAAQALVDAVTKAAQSSIAPLQQKIEEQAAEIAGLQQFKDDVQAQVSNGHQGPIQTLANIIALGGEGFGTPKA